MRALEPDRTPNLSARSHVARTRLSLISLSRLFYRPEQSGLTKTAAARATLTAINPDVAFETYDYNIVTVANFEDFLQRCVFFAAHRAGLAANAGLGSRPMPGWARCRRRAGLGARPTEGWGARPTQGWAGFEAGRHPG